MRKTNKVKRISLLIACIFAAMTVSITVIVLPVSAASYGGECGEDIVWTYDSDSGVLNITGTGDMTDYDEYTDVPWYPYRSSIKTVNISSGITSIGDMTFAFCGNIARVDIPEGVTRIGAFAFKDCTSIEEFTIPNTVTDIGESAFYRCSSVENFDIPNSVVTIGESSFSYCYGVKHFVIPESVTSIGDCAFSVCRNLESITIPASVTDIGVSVFATSNADMVIKGEDGSAAQKHADENGIAFELIGAEAEDSSGSEGGSAFEDNKEIETYEANTGATKVGCTSSVGGGEAVLISFLIAFAMTTKDIFKKGKK